MKYTRFAQSGLRTNNDAHITLVPAQSVTVQHSPHSEASTAERLHPFVILLLISIAMPIYFNFGTLRLSPNRIILMVAFFPVMWRWLTGVAGRLRTADYCVIGLCIWGAIAMFVSVGMSAIQYSGITTVETLGAYLVGRTYVRTEAHYQTVIRILGIIIILLVPGAIVESLTGIRIYNQIFDSFTSTFPWANYEKRLYMFRAQTVFEHPILFGVFTSICFTPLFAIAKAKVGMAKAWMYALPAIVATFFSLSMGAYLILMTQLFLMFWGLLLNNFRNRWRILGALSAAAYVIVDLISNRTPFQVFSSYVTFDAETAYWRVLIFKYGMQNVAEHPLFGLGAFINDWKRPEFMYTSSVDNLWLVFAMHDGIPGFLLILGVYLAVMVGLMRAKLLDPVLQCHRDALAFSFIGLGIAICTVHLWSATFVFMMFMLGASAWFSDVTTTRPVSPDTNAVADETVRRASDRTRLTATRPPAR